MFGAPPARFRLYTASVDYLRLIGDLILGRTAAGDDVERLERALEAYGGSPHAVCLPQGRLGVYLAVKLLITPGQRVVLSPYTIADVINMVLAAGGVPVFADIDRRTTNIRADSVEALIDEQTGAVMVTHLHGIACDITAIAEICRHRHVPLIEDAAQAFGARVDGRLVGTFGDVGVFSFGMYKNVTAFYGGALVTPRRALADAARAELAGAPYLSLRVLGSKALKALVTDIVTSPLLFKTLVYWIFRFGYLHDIAAINRFVTVELDLARHESLPPHYLRRLRSVQARMVLRQLPHVDANAIVRRGYSALYHEGLRGLPALVLPPLRDDGSCVYNYFSVQYRDREALVRWLMQHRRDVAVQHLKNCAALPGFEPEQRPCPDAALTASQTILLPNYPGYGEDSVRENVAAIRRFFDVGPGAHG